MFKAFSNSVLLVSASQIALAHFYHSWIFDSYKLITVTYSSLKNAKLWRELKQKLIPWNFESNILCCQTPITGNLLPIWHFQGTVVCSLQIPTKVMARHAYGKNSTTSFGRFTGLNVQYIVVLPKLNDKRVVIIFLLSVDLGSTMVPSKEHGIYKMLIIYIVFQVL